MSKVLEILDKQQFDEILESDLPVFIDFGASWCGPCKTMMPIVSEVAEQYDKKIIFAKVDIDHLPTLASDYNIRSIPHCILFKQKRVVASLIGLQSEAGLIEFLELHLITQQQPL